MAQPDESFGKFGSLSSYCVQFHAQTLFILILYEDMNMDKKKIQLIAVSVLIVLVVVSGYFYWKNNKSVGSAEADIQSAVDAANSITESAMQGVLPSIGEAINPLTNKPDINPTSKTNPFQ